MDSNTWTHQCWSTGKDINSSALCRHWVPSIGLNQRDGTYSYMYALTKINRCLLTPLWQSLLYELHVSLKNIIIKRLVRQNFLYSNFYSNLQSWIEHLNDLNTFSLFSSLCLFTFYPLFSMFYLFHFLSIFIPPSLLSPFLSLSAFLSSLFLFLPLFSSITLFSTKVRC